MKGDPSPKIQRKKTQSVHEAQANPRENQSGSGAIHAQVLTKRMKRQWQPIPDFTGSEQRPPPPDKPPTPPRVERPRLSPQRNRTQILADTAPDKSPLLHTTTLNKVYGANVAKVESMKAVWLKAALKLLDAHRAKADSADLAKLSGFCQQNLEKINKNIESGESQENLILNSNDMEKIFPVELPKTLYKGIAKSMGISEKVAKERLRNAYIRELNNQPWDPIVNPINLGTSQKPDVFTSTITPVNENYHETFAKYGKTGLNSMSTSSRLTDMTDDELNRTTNLAFTELKHEVTGRVLFRAFRSGALAGKNIPNDKAKAERVTAANTHELLQAMVIQQLRESRPDLQSKYFDETEPDVMRVPVLSLNLQSAAWLLGGEGEHVEEQLKALRANHLKKQEIEVVWPDKMGKLEKRKVQVQFDVIAMNFGVNAQGFSFAQNNNEPLARLEERKDHFVQQAKARAKELSENAEKVLLVEKGQTIGSLTKEYHQLVQSVEQVEELWKRIKSGKGNTSSYEMSSQILNLGHLIGSNLHFNCKSGKDRTGLQDAEAKFMAHELFETANAKDLKPYEIASSEPGRTNKLQTLLFASGNLEMQQYNTGGQGYKIAPAANLLLADKRLQSRIGGSDVLKQLQGLKRYTEIDKI